MEKLNNTITVPSGEYEVLNYKGTVFTSLYTPGIKYPRYQNNYYAKGVGRILQTCFYIHSPAIIEKRLIRYNIHD